MSTSNRATRYFLPLLCATALVGCATTVVTPETEGQLGAVMSQEVDQQIGRYYDPQLSAYVDAVGKRLVAAGEPTPYTFRFAVIDQPEPNAFAAPGGYIYVSRGLMAQMNSEAELAGVLAHEISHVTRRHHTKQLGKEVGASLLKLPGAAVGVINEDLGRMINSPIDTAGRVALAGYSRSQESEADAYGMGLAAAAGYDPAELAGALEGIDRTVEALTGEQHQASYFDTHPTTPTRVADIEKQADRLQWQPAPPLADQAGLYRRLDGLWWGADNPQQGVFKGQQFMSSDLDLSITFPPEWKTINTPMFVGAAEPEGNAYVALGSGERVENPSDLSEALARKMYERAGIEPSERRAFSVGDWPASVVRYDDTSGPETVSLYYAFVTTPGETYTLMAMGLEAYREGLRDTVMSLRQLSDEEAASIEGLRLRLAERRPGESLDDFNARVGNRWPGNLTAAINGIEQSAPSSEGQLLKIIRRERYVPAP
jgi:predicted Zn-dependent protease